MIRLVCEICPVEYILIPMIFFLEFKSFPLKPPLNSHFKNWELLDSLSYEFFASTTPTPPSHSFPFPNQIKPPVFFYRFNFISPSLIPNFLWLLISLSSSTSFWFSSFSFLPRVFKFLVCFHDCKLSSPIMVFVSMVKRHSS